MGSGCHPKTHALPTLGKMRVYNGRGGRAPPGISELMRAWIGEVRQGDKPPLQYGVVALRKGFQVVCLRPVCASTQIMGRAPASPSCSVRGFLLLLCATPSAQHLLRTVPPPVVAEYARANDAEVWRALQDILGAQHRIFPRFVCRAVGWRSGQVVEPVEIRPP